VQESIIFVNESQTGLGYIFCSRNLFRETEGSGNVVFEKDAENFVDGEEE